MNSLDKFSDRPFRVLERFKDKIKIKDETVFLECLKNKIEKGTGIGYGQCADVITFSKEDGFEGVCVKRIKRAPLVKINDVEQEMTFQDKADDLGVRVPVPLFILSRGLERYIVMEQINGISIGDAMETGGIADFIQANNFNPVEFFDTLDKYISTLHKEGIYHRDLHTGNVMLDYETGGPVIIDFGSADYGFGDDTEIYKSEGQRLINPRAVEAETEEPKYVKITDLLRNDVEHISGMKSAVMSFLKNKGFFN